MFYVVNNPKQLLTLLKIVKSKVIMKKYLFFLDKNQSHIFCLETIHAHSINRIFIMISIVGIQYVTK